MQKEVYIFLAEGFEEIEALTPLDVLRRAGLLVKSVSITNDLYVKGAHDIVVKADKLIAEIAFNQAQMLILPGGMPGSDNLYQCELLKTQLKSFFTQDKYIAAICAAPYILGELDILKGKKATCYPGYENQLKGAVVTQAQVEVDGKIITAKGIGAAMAFSLQIIAVLFDKDKAIQLSERMMCKNENVGQ